MPVKILLLILKHAIEITIQKEQIILILLAFSWLHIKERRNCMKIPSFLTIFSLIILLLLYGCSTRQSNIPSGIFSYPSAPSAPSEAELYAFVEEAMPPLDRWRQAYEALSAGEQAQVREWLGWYQGLGEEDREMLSYRPGGFGCFFEIGRASCRGSV